MKKGTFLTSVLVLSFVGSLLVGCSGAPEGNENAQSQTTTAAQAGGSKKLGKMDEHLGVK